MASGVNCSENYGWDSPLWVNTDKSINKSRGKKFQFKSTFKIWKLPASEFNFHNTIKAHTAGSNIESVFLCTKRSLTR